MWDFLSENRLPQYVPLYYLYAKIIQRWIERLTVPTRLNLSLTFDLENSWGDEEQIDLTEIINFIKKIANIKQSDITFFIPGNLVDRLSSHLHTLSQSNGIGLHGYRHELWRPAYFVNKLAIADAMKPDLILKSLKAFKANGLKQPTAFRAPYMYCKPSDIRLIEKAGFTVDSSDPSFKGVHSIRQTGNITRIPVTAHPVPYFKSRKGITFTKFHLFNLKTLNEFHNQNFLEFIGQILKWQVYRQQIPHLVFLAHPWEFFTNSADEFDENFTHRGLHNYEVLKDRLALLENNFDVRYVTMNQLSCLYKENR